MKHWLPALLPCALLAQAVPDSVIVEKGIEFSRVGEKTELDLARPKAAGPARAAIVAIHGGGFRAGRRESYSALILKLAERGYVAATIDYRLSPKHQFPSHLEDAKAAVRWMRANAAKYNIDPDRIGVVGGSAGGHLALMLGLTGGVKEFEGYGPNLDQPSHVQCVVNYYGPTDFTKSYGKSVDAAEVLPLFLGGDLQHQEAAHRKASPLNWVNPNAAPVLSIHGTKDRYVAYEHSVWITERLRGAGVEAELLGLEGADHGFKGPDAAKAESAMFAWFDKHLAPKPRRKLLIADHGPLGEVLLIDFPSGKVHWKVPNNRSHDVQALPNGHVLYTTGTGKRAVEIDANRKEVWSYGENMQHVIAAERLSNGNTLIADAVRGIVIEVTPDKKIVWQYANPEMDQMKMRNVRSTPQGTVLIAIERLGKIIEVGRAGQIVWTYAPENGIKRLPYRAIRLANGNTLVSMADPGEAVEVDKAGNVVRSFGGNQMKLRMGWTSGTEVVPGGGFLLNDYTGRRIVEVNARGDVVAEWKTGPRTIASIALVP